MRKWDRNYLVEKIINRKFNYGLSDPHSIMCIIHFHPMSREISKEEIEAADQDAVDHGDEDDYYESDAESLSTSDLAQEDEEFADYMSDEESSCSSGYEVKDSSILGLRGLNDILSILGEDEVLEEKWRPLCTFQKMVVLDIILSLDDTEMKDSSEKGKEAVAHIRAIVEGKSDENGNIAKECAHHEFL